MAITGRRRIGIELVAGNESANFLVTVEYVEISRNIFAANAGPCVA